ncbi:MAG: hypothetical protein SAJ12_21670 [Jaaginema sp. PMC 1079.18]|nr:hypothetical protein [Jaaginema sp. PMC 1080.18]MEC4853598.1 hypothetical protein [Jaaginema sp. PMC 1079.18]MEC4868161.1 hypothetical protein [Jaaginema sp. PMC 1078.18]
MLSQALSVNPILPPTQILSHLHSGQLLRIDARSGNGVIVCHRHYAQILGPGAAVGGIFDLDCRRIITIGQVSLVYPESLKEKRQAFLTRKKWINSTQKIAQHPSALQRATILLRMLERYCGTEIAAQLPTEVLAQIVGVLPSTMATAGKMMPQHQSSEKTASRSLVVSTS